MSTKNNSRHHDNWVSTSSSKRRNVCSDRKKLIPHSLTFHMMYVPPFSVLCTTYHYPIKVSFCENIYFDDNLNKLNIATNMIYNTIVVLLQIWLFHIQYLYLSLYCTSSTIMIITILSMAIYHIINILRGVKVMLRKVIRDFLFFNAVCL